MRKRLGILLLIFSLFLFFPTQKTYGQVGNLSMPGTLGAEALVLLPVALILSLFIDGDKCDLIWHPGDYYYEKNYKIINPINMKVMECHNNCEKKMDKSLAMGSVRSNEKNRGVNYSECYNPCVIDAFKPFPTSVSACKYEGIKGHYSDGSYYDSRENSNLKMMLINKHKLRNRYEKTEWQQARDECMELTSKKGKFFETPVAQHERLLGLYNDCLKERGY